MSTSRRRIYLDSSVLIGTVIEGVNHAAACRDYCDRLIADRSTVVMSTLSRYEMAHLASTLGNPSTRRRLPEIVTERFNLAAWDNDIEVRDRWMTGMATALESLIADFDDFAEVPVLPSFWHAARQIMIEYDFQSFDALHIVTAHASGRRSSRLQIGSSRESMA